MCEKWQKCTEKNISRVDNNKETLINVQKRGFRVLLEHYLKKWTTYEDKNTKTKLIDFAVENLSNIFNIIWEKDIIMALKYINYKVSLYDSSDNHPDTLYDVLFWEITNSEVSEIGKEIVRESRIKLFELKLNKVENKIDKYNYNLVKWLINSKKYNEALDKLDRINSFSPKLLNLYRLETKRNNFYKEIVVYFDENHFMMTSKEKAHYSNKISSDLENIFKKIWTENIYEALKYVKSNINIYIK